MVFNNDNYDIDIQIIKSDTGKDIIRIQDKRNDFIGRCRVDEVDEFIKFLDWVEEHEYYDEEWEEYTVPSEWELWDVIYDYEDDGGYKFDKETFYGNFILVDRIYYIQEAIREFIVTTFSINEVAKECDNIEDLKNKLRQHDISTLMFMSERIEQPQLRPVEVDEQIIK